MKKTITSLLAALLLLSAFHVCAFAEGFEIRAFEGCELYTVDKASNTWKIVGGYAKEDSNANIDIYVFLVL